MIREKKDIHCSTLEKKKEFGVEESRRKLEQDNGNDVVIYLKLQKKFSQWCWISQKTKQLTSLLCCCFAFCDLIISPSSQTFNKDSSIFK